MLIEKYSPDWIRHFQDIKGVLDKCLSGLTYQIEHVGSTSVPLLDSKPIIDIDIIHKKDVDFEGIKGALMTIGYYHNGDQGIAKREVFKRNGQKPHNILDRIKHHLYVCPVGSEELERHLLFRDFLRKNEGERKEYQTLKYRLAEKAAQNQKHYAELKEAHVNTFIDKVIEKERLLRRTTNT